MNPIDKTYALIVLCVLGALMIEAHYFLRVLIHRRRTALANLSQNRERSESDGTGSKQSNHQKLKHDGLLF